MQRTKYMSVISFFLRNRLCITMNNVYIAFGIALTPLLKIQVLLN